METQTYSNDELNINTDAPTPYKNDYNYEERLTKLEEENTMIKSDKRNKESEIDSLSNTINSLKIKNETLNE